MFPLFYFSYLQFIFSNWDLSLLRVPVSQKYSPWWLLFSSDLELEQGFPLLPIVNFGPLKMTDFFFLKLTDFLKTTHDQTSSSSVPRNYLLISWLSVFHTWPLESFYKCRCPGPAPGDSDVATLAFRTYYGSSPGNKWCSSFSEALS